MDEIVDDPADVTPEWLSRVLGTEVVGLRHERLGGGQLSACYRFHLDVTTPGAPTSVVLKLATGTPAGRARIVPGYRSEVGFYQRFADTARIRAPHCFSATITPDGQCFTLVLADGHPARPGNQLDGCTLPRAEAAIRNLAGLHTPFWQRDDLADGLTWLRRSDEATLTFLAEVFAGATTPFLDRFRADLDPATVDTLLRTADRFGNWGRHVGDRHTLTHGDYRLDNLLFADLTEMNAAEMNAAEVTALDFQSLEIGFPGRDVAYFLSTALTPELRRAHEQDLVRIYHDELARFGITDHPFEECFRDYRLGPLQGPLLTVLGCVYGTNDDTEASDAMFRSMITNSCTAIRDLGTLELIAG
jgi:hypothetical protein